jgi:hypothetical protein
MIIEPGIGKRPALRVFSLYADLPAGVHAKRVTDQIKELTAGNCELLTELWRLDSVNPADPIREMIALEAIESDVLVVAISAADRHQLAMLSWLDSLTAAKAKPPGARWLIGLFGTSPDRERESDWRIDQLTLFAPRSRMNFVWQWMPRGTRRDPGWLAVPIGRLIVRKKLLWNYQTALATASADTINA